MLVDEQHIIVAHTIVPHHIVFKKLYALKFLYLRIFVKTLAIDQPVKMRLSPCL